MHLGPILRKRVNSFGFTLEQKSDSKKKSKKKQVSKEERLQKEREKAELELLMIDGEDKEKSHFSAKDIIKSEKVKSKKQKKKLQKQSLDTQDDFKMDLADPRFSSLIEDHEFFIDPTNSQ